MEQLEHLYTIKKEKIEKILKLTTQQKLAIESQDVEQLHNLLAERQTVMDEVDGLNGEIGRLEKSGLSSAMAESIRILKREIDTLWQQIAVLDEQNKAALNRQFLEVKRKIIGLKNSKTVQQAYFPNRQQNFGYFVDNKK